jgi:hypothetical protein
MKTHGIWISTALALKLSRTTSFTHGRRESPSPLDHRFKAYTGAQAIQDEEEQYMLPYDEESILFKAVRFCRMCKCPSKFFYV